MCVNTVDEWSAGGYNMKENGSWLYPYTSKKRALAACKECKEISDVPIVLITQYPGGLEEIRIYPFTQKSFDLADTYGCWRIYLKQKSRIRILGVTIE